MDTILNHPAFVIHLEDVCKERKEFFMSSITNAGFTNIEIIPGVNGRNAEYILNNITKFNTKFDLEVSSGGIGCCLSHLNVLKKIIDENIPLATVFEDDVWFHPEWKKLSEEYLKETPGNYDILFIGNGLDSCVYNSKTTPKVTTESCWCTHAYVITNQGAHKLFNSLLNWDYKNFNHSSRGKTLNGLYCIDIMIKDIQNNILQKTIPELFKWYCWNGTVYPYKQNLFPLTGNDRRNTGLVMQAADQFVSSVAIHINIYDDKFYDENLQVVDISGYEATEQWIADTFIPENAVVLELGGRYGVVSAKINNRLKIKTNHLVVEPDPTIFPVMSQNLAKKGANCKLFNGVVSKKPLFFQSAGLGSRTREVPCSCEAFCVPNKSLQELIDITGLKFDTLVADCEGCLGMFFEENIDYIDNFKLVTFEEDYGDFCDYEKIKQILRDKNFECIRPGGHSVWTKKQTGVTEVPKKPVITQVSKKRFTWSS
jgi:GR25 family glycosyltransferase involved in LPS biosynthesis